MNYAVRGARVILPNDVVETDVIVADGRIAEIGAVQADETIDARGRVLAPALIDIHGDAFERQNMPRPNVFFPMDAAVLETDRQLAGNGIATAYHALTLSWEPGLRAVDRGAAFVDAIERLAPRCLVENRIQLRWETFAFEARELITRVLNGALTPSLAFNDHTSMTMRSFDIAIQDRAFEHSPAFAALDPEDPRLVQKRSGASRRAGLSPEDYARRLLEVWERRPEVPDVIRSVADEARAVGAPMLSHDDTQEETRDFYRAIGAPISEFPMRVPVAKSARDAGDAIVFGAPNAVRGGSHIGSPSAADMVEDGLCDILASDYFYPAMLAAVSRLHDEMRAPLPALWSLVSAGPADALGLSDRGRIAPGQRADLVLLDWPDDAIPAVSATIVGGRMAYQANASC
ncbi:MAG: alpha-D-ribose 1-methylphosphonate 5-triphosphate diphosphatase [Pseudomonadota bacterium]